ncbi:hypothetical protein HDU67_002742 [Dinochytrium kinnereticum]|nr:hypothetical protein HDU67_002742 [Dinochytrium kinnereticum]
MRTISTSRTRPGYFTSTHYSFKLCTRFRIQSRIFSLYFWTRKKRARMNATEVKSVSAILPSVNGNAPSNLNFVPLVPLHGATVRTSIAASPSLSRNVDIFPPPILSSTDGKDVKKQQIKQLAATTVQENSEKENHVVSAAPSLIQPFETPPSGNVKFFPSSDGSLSRDLMDDQRSLDVSLARAANEKSSNLYSAALHYGLSHAEATEGTSRISAATAGTVSRVSEVSTWSCDQVAEWLLSIGLGPQLVDIFKGENINGYVLLNVTDAFLTDIGIQSASARTFILIAVDEIKGIAPMTYTRERPNTDAPPQYS